MIIFSSQQQKLAKESAKISTYKDYYIKTSLYNVIH